jgi:hypothetical protein
VPAARKNRERIFRVLVGPYEGRDAAKKAVRKLKDEMKIDAFLAKG